MFEHGTQRPSQPEAEYFAREDAENKRRLALQVKREMAEEERQRLKALHYLHCPKCGMEMHEVKLKGLDVDLCFACGGVFLDRSEVDVIAAPQQKGIMAAILNWLRPEWETPVKR
ncbi:MAG TPA: zf-TFIIB domain-containing protein [Anaeromyxobacteraceae bacterium]|nr:zf-TFIIB domain-containing protein [Anaeromyxobacteraceae bacterium]